MEVLIEAPVIDSDAVACREFPELFSVIVIKNGYRVVFSNGIAVIKELCHVIAASDVIFSVYIDNRSKISIADKGTPVLERFCIAVRAQHYLLSVLVYIVVAVVKIENIVSVTVAYVTEIFALIQFLCDDSVISLVELVVGHDDLGIKIVNYKIICFIGGLTQYMIPHA